MISVNYIVMIQVHVPQPGTPELHRNSEGSVPHPTGAVPRPAGAVTRPTGGVPNVVGAVPRSTTNSGANVSK